MSPLQFLPLSPMGVFRQKATPSRLMASHCRLSYACRLLILVAMTALLPASVCWASEPAGFVIQGESGPRIDELDPAHELGDPEPVVDPKLDESPPATRGPLRRRLIAIAISIGCLLTLLAILFVYLRLEHFTRGFYSARLQMIAALVAGLAIIASYLIWLSLAG